MKKIILTLVLSSFLFSCGVVRQIDSKVDQCYLGMSVSELQNLFGNDLKLKSMKDGWTVYSVETKYNNMDYTGTHTYYKFFYFENDGKLVQMDEGQKATDVKLEIYNK